MMMARAIMMLGFYLLLPLALCTLWVADGFALQKGEVIIDGRIKITVEVARTRHEQAKGLAGRSSLPKGEGMLFPFDAEEHRTFWMKGMLIPIDIVWIREGKVATINANIPPPRSHETPAVVRHLADLVLEVPAGYAQEMGISEGQAVRVTYEGVSH
jgi:uncharacterized membrane protein (UPF0127 family)